MSHLPGEHEYAGNEEPAVSRRRVWNHTTRLMYVALRERSARGTTRVESGPTLLLVRARLVRNHIM